MIMLMTMMVMMMMFWLPYLGAGLAAPPRGVFDRGRDILYLKHLKSTCIRKHLHLKHLKSNRSTTIITQRPLQCIVAELDRSSLNEFHSIFPFPWNSFQVLIDS